MDKQGQPELAANTTKTLKESDFKYYYYDELDEFGVDKKMPKSLIKEFKYEPDIISEELVRLQKVIHSHHKTIEKYLERTIDGIFWAERATIKGFDWMDKNGLRVALSTTQVAAVASLAHFANQNAPRFNRFGSIAAVSLMAGFLVYPSWRTTMTNFIQTKLISPIPVFQKTFDGIENGYWNGVFKLVGVWDQYDLFVDKIKKHYDNSKLKVKNTLWPPRRPRGADDDGDP